MRPIFLLTLRALARGRRLLVVAALLLVPALLALIYRLSAPYNQNGAHPPQPFRDYILPFQIDLFSQLVVPILLPLTALIFATSALGGEIEDRTLIYLTLRPVSRLTIGVAKLLATALVTVVLVEASLALTYAIAAQGQFGAGDGLAAILLAGLAGCLGYVSLFLLIGLLAPRRALLIGFIYVMAWEGLAAGFSTGLATLSVRRYVEGILHAGLNAIRVPEIQWPNVTGATSIAVLAAIFIAGLALTTWQLHRIELT